MAASSGGRGDRCAVERRARWGRGARCANLVWLAAGRVRARLAAGRRDLAGRRHARLAAGRRDLAGRRHTRLTRPRHAGPRRPHLRDHGRAAADRADPRSDPPQRARLRGRPRSLSLRALALPVATEPCGRADGAAAVRDLRDDRRARARRSFRRHDRLAGADAARAAARSAAAAVAAGRDARRGARRPDVARPRSRRRLAGRADLRAHAGLLGRDRRGRPATPRPPGCRSPASPSRSPPTARSSSRGRRPPGAWRPATSGRLDERGRLIVLGRKVDTIVSGGENVMPAEVEAVLLAHPAVAEAGVFGRPDPEWGEAVTAHVVLRSPADPAELRAFAAAASLASRSRRRSSWSTRYRATPAASCCAATSARTCAGRPLRSSSLKRRTV